MRFFNTAGPGRPERHYSTRGTLVIFDRRPPRPELPPLPNRISFHETHTPVRAFRDLAMRLTQRRMGLIGAAGR